MFVFFKFSAVIYGIVLLTSKSVCFKPLNSFESLPNDLAHSLNRRDPWIEKGCLTDESACQTYTKQQSVSGNSKGGLLVQSRYHIGTG